ncbi:MAG TPA: nuclear transport factor 2 family protein [Acidimicrobiales bacterium]|nr:nuclear transport factor 2 family protein [Acidimicrobiales bacterium]
MDSVLETVRSALEAGDPAPIMAIFSQDVQLHSPAIIGPEYRGRDLVASIVIAAMKVLKEVRVTDVFRAEDAATAGVVFDARVRELPSQGFMLLRTRGEHIRELTVLLRPLAALGAFVSAMAELGAQPALDARNE